MSDPHGRDVTIAAFMLDYERHLTDVDGLAPNSRKLHLRAVRGLLKTCFALGNICWHELRFSYVAEFLMKEFKRLPNHHTQRVSLMAVRRLVRYLASEGQIPSGWEDALPKRVTRKQSGLPRYLSPEERQALWSACQRKTHRHLRDRAMLLVYTRLGLRTEEVARLTLKDIDWKGGQVRVRSTKTRRERMLPLAQDVGQGLVEHFADPAIEELPVGVRSQTPSLHGRAYPSSRPQHYVRSVQACGAQASPCPFAPARSRHGNG
jgi:integrase/recombinase XerD